VPDLAEILKEHNLAPEEYERIVSGLGREPNLVELGIFSAMWSEHCCYKSSSAHLASLPTSGSCVIQGPGENAGVVDIGDGLAVVFKIESHNHPSFIEPFQGAATGVGGIIRDIFTMGARPFALLDSLHFGGVGRATDRYLLKGVVSGISFYGNCIGIPTVGGQTLFADCYSKNPLVNVMCAGLVARDAVFLGRATGPGNLVVYAGSSTGRDGLHGATMASASFDEASQERRITVQVGDPFAEKLLMEACLELMQKRIVVGIQDMGAAGLTCSTSEMAFRAGTGVRIDISKVPRRAEGLSPYEIMLSESQERMLIVVEPDKEAEVKRVFDRWGVLAVPIGVVTDDGRLVVIEGETKVADIPLELLIGQPPKCNRPVRKPPDATLAGDIDSDLGQLEPKEALLLLLRSPNICQKRWVFEQYDHLIGTNTVAGPGADAAVMRVKGTRKAVALCLDGSGARAHLDPYQGAVWAVAESFLNVVCVGAKPLAITNCLNFGNPEDPVVMWQFVEAVRGLKDACEALNVPVTGGNVSFYNETSGKSIYPTPVVGMLGTLEDVSKVVRPGFVKPGDVILVLGRTVPTLGGSELATVTLGRQTGRPQPVDLAAHLRLSQVMLDLAQAGLLRSAHDCSEGGIAVALLESCFLARNGGPAGARIDLPTDMPASLWLFAESPSRVVISVSRKDLSSVERVLADSDQEYAVIGEVVEGRFVVRQGRSAVIDEDCLDLARIWSSAFEEMIFKR